jgi:LytS/YehU family sensor histidine kinase
MIIAFDMRLQLAKRITTRRFLTHLAVAPLLLIFYVYLSAVLAAAMQAIPWSRVFDSRLLPKAMQGILWNVLIYCLILGVWSAYRNHLRYVSAELGIEKLERNFSEARLNALRMQLDPHFLFNALNTISSQVTTEPKLARKMIEHLGDLLRLSLDQKSRNEISLMEEMAFLTHYLAIQKIRFGDSLNIVTEISSEANLAAVPSLIMQPLVENAIRHGLSRRAGGGTVTIIARREEDMLTIKVLDDGVGLYPDWRLDRQTGLGLSVTRERISVLHPHGPNHFIVAPRTGGGVEVSLSFPFHLMKDAYDRADI